MELQEENELLKQKLIKAESELAKTRLELIKYKSHEILKGYMDKLIDMLPMPVFYKYSNENQTGYNKAFADFFGFGGNQNKSENIKSVLYEIYGRPFVERNMEGQSVIQTRIKTVFKEEHDVIFYKSFIYEGGQEGPLGITGAILDVSKLISTEKALKESQYRHQLLLEEAGNPILIFGTDACVQMINKTAGNLVGLAPEVLIGKHPSDFFHPDISNKITVLLDKIVKTGQGRRIDHSILIKEKLYWFVSQMTPVFNEAGQVTGVLVISQDITDQKQTESELRLARNKAIESDQLKLSFLANISHEIRTPMNSIMGFAQILQRPNLSNETIKEYADLINTGSMQLLTLINDIVDISKIESGQVSVFEMDFSIDKMLQELLHFFKRAAQRKKISLQVFIPPAMEGLIIKTDYSKIKQIFSNLIANAIKFTPTGTVTFGFTFRNDDICFFVEDTGIGIDKEKQEVIFERFRQADSSISSKYGGTGLGLAISKSFILMLGGTLSVDSESNKGAKFEFKIPFKPGYLVPENPVKEVEPSFKWDTYKILIAEDEEDNFKVMMVWMQWTGVSYCRVGNGKEAVEKAGSENFDLVLMDIKMPEMDGLTATRLIKSKNPKLPVIALTAFAHQDDKRKAMEAGCCAYVAKPYQINQIMKLIDEILKGKNNGLI